MTTRNHDRIYDEAVRWHSSLGEPDVDWAALAAWLDLSEVHQAIYDRVALLDSDVDLLRGQIAATLPVNDVDEAATPREANWRSWVGIGFAAALVLAIGTPHLFSLPPRMTAYETGAGGSRLVALNDGSSVRLDGNTRVLIGGGARRSLRLERGAAFFDVHHDAARPFSVSSGDYEIRDIGTSFSVSRQAAVISVAVATGLVNVSLQGGRAQAVAAGEQYDGNASARTAELHRVDPADVASWRGGRLVYDNAPISVVAADISRYSSETVTVDPAIKDLRLSAVLIIGNGTHLVDQVQALLPVKVRRLHHHVWLLGLLSRR